DLRRFALLPAALVLLAACGGAATPSASPTSAAAAPARSTSAAAAAPTTASSASARPSSNSSANAVPSQAAGKPEKSPLKAIISAEGSSYLPVRVAEEAGYFTA